MPAPTRRLRPCRKPDHRWKQLVPMLNLPRDGQSPEGRLGSALLNPSCTLQTPGGTFKHYLCLGPPSTPIKSESGMTDGWGRPEPGKRSQVR